MIFTENIYEKRGREYEIREERRGGGEGGMMMNDVTKNTVCTLRREQRSPGTSRDSEDPLQAT